MYLEVLSDSGQTLVRRCPCVEESPGLVVWQDFELHFLPQLVHLQVLEDLVDQAGVAVQQEGVGSAADEDPFVEDPAAGVQEHCVQAASKQGCGQKTLS